MGQFDISAHPLVDQGRNESGRETKHKAQRPHRVHPDNGGSRGRGRIGLRHGKCTIREPGKLLRDLPEIERIPVAWIGG